eukprot:1160883-Pelagomonas_calceolata.AAC.13
MGVLGIWAVPSAAGSNKSPKACKPGCACACACAWAPLHVHASVSFWKCVVDAYNVCAYSCVGNKVEGMSGP